MLLGVFGGTGALLAQRSLKLGPDLDAALLFVGKQSVLLIVIGAFLLFARFRFADVFLQQSLRILLAGASAVALVALTEAPFLSEWTTRVPFPKAAGVFAASLVAAAFLLGLRHPRSAAGNPGEPMVLQRAGSSKCYTAAR